MHILRQQPQQIHDDATKCLLGGVSSVLGMLFVYPIDTIKIQQQIQDGKRNSRYALGMRQQQRRNIFQSGLMIAKQDGVGRRGIFRGIEASCAREMLYAGMRLGMYEPIKRSISTEETTLTRFLAGACSGFLASGFANPTDLLKTRMQAQDRCRPLKWHIRDVYYHHGGLAGFYKGVNVTMARGTVLSAVHLGTYDTIKQHLISTNVSQSELTNCFVASVSCGFFAALATSPIDNVRTRIMSDQRGRYKSIGDCVTKMIQQEGGGRAFFRGFGAMWAGMAPYTVIQLLTWEYLRSMAGFEGI